MAATWGFTVADVRAETAYCLSQQAYVCHMHGIHLHDMSFSQVHVALVTNMIFAKA